MSNKTTARKSAPGAAAKKSAAGAAPKKNSGTATVKKLKPESQEKTYGEVHNYISHCKHYLHYNPEDSDLKDCLDEMAEQVNAVAKEHTKKVDQIKRKHSTKDRWGNDMYDELPEGGRQYKLKGEAFDLVDQEIEQLTDKTVVIDPIYCEKLPKGFKEVYRKAFTGFVIKG